MRSHAGVAMGLFQSLSQAGINVDLMSTSEVRVNVLVDSRRGAKSAGMFAEDVRGERRRRYAVDSRR